MKDHFLLISRCVKKSQRIIDHKEYEKVAQFHYCGSYLGYWVQDCFLYHNPKYEFRENEECLLWIKFLAIKRGKIIGTLIKCKRF